MPESVTSRRDAYLLASRLARQSGALVSGWYTQRDGVVTNYFVHVLDLNQRILVKLSLLT